MTLDILQFLFRDFWTWAGFVVLIGATCHGLSKVIWGNKAAKD